MENEHQESKSKYMAARRMKTCMSCEHFFKPTKQCKKCGCFMWIKVRMENQSCPVGKW